jgi:hypothetical protein
VQTTIVWAMSPATSNDSSSRSRSPTSSWWKYWGAAAVLGRVVGCPHAPEVVAAHRQLPDELGQITVIGIACRFGSQAADGGRGESFPPAVEDAGSRVEEHEAGAG